MNKIGRPRKPLTDWSDYRIFSVVARTVQPNAKNEGLSVLMPSGRMAAQSGHVVSKMRVELAFERNQKDTQPITTIIKECRDSRELNHVRYLLEQAGIQYETFFDENPDYGVGVHVTTAICTYPVLPADVAGVLDYLPLFLRKKVLNG